VLLGHPQTRDVGARPQSVPFLALLDYLQTSDVGARLRSVAFLEAHPQTRPEGSQPTAAVEAVTVQWAEDVACPLPRHPTCPTHRCQKLLVTWHFPSRESVACVTWKRAVHPSTLLW
jgi:hypothetical protein